MSDFYMLVENGEVDRGCCLLCSDSYDGCLCFSCKCKKCDHYAEGAFSSGSCMLADKFAEERKHPICICCGLDLEWKNKRLCDARSDIPHTEVCKGDILRSIKRGICVKCGKRLIKIDGDDIADFRCSKCGVYFKIKKETQTTIGAK